MELTKHAQAIKDELALELAKTGSSLLDFDQALSSINTGEGVFKIASDSGGILNSYLNKGMNFSGDLTEMAMKGSMAGGALAGLTLDEADKSVEMLNKALDREREKVNLVRRITQNLKREHGLI